MKLIWKILLGVSLAIALAIGCLPLFLSTSWGKQYLLQTLNEHLPGTMKAAQVRFSWVGPQELLDIDFKDLSGIQILKAAAVQADIPLHQLIFHKKPYGSVHIKQLNLQFKDVGISNAYGSIELPQELGKPVKLLLHGQTYQIINDSTQLGNFDIDLVLNSLDIARPQSLAIKIEKFPVALFNHLLALYHPSLESIPTQILGNTINLSLEQNLYPNNGEEEEHLLLKVLGDKLNATLGLQLKNNILSINHPASFSFILPSELCNHLTSIYEHPISPFNVELALDEMQFPLAFFFPSEKSVLSLNDSIFLIRLNISPLSPIGTDNGPFILKQLTGNLEASSASSTATIHLDGEILAQEQPFHIHLKAVMDKPLYLRDLWEKMHQQIVVEAKVENEKMMLQGALQGLLSENQQILITEPVKLTLTPPQSDGSKLPELTELTIQPPKQPIVLWELAPGYLKKLELNGELAIHHWIHRKVEIETLNIPWILDGPGNQINSRLYGHTRVATQDTGELYGECKLSNWLDPKGKLQLDKLKFKAKAHGKGFPIAVVETLCGGSTIHLSDLLGETIDYNVDLKGALSPQVSGFLNLSLTNPQMEGSLALEISDERMAGPIHFQVKGENGNLSLDGHFNQKGLLLDRPLQMEIAVNPKLGRSLLAEIVPILTGVLHSEQPLRLTIEPQGFFLPFAPFDLASLRIEKATLELGHLTFRNEGQLDVAFSLLRPGQHEPITAWCTPLYFSVLGGKVALQRMDMLLVNRYPMALWGNIYLLKDKVDLRIGLTGTALLNSLNISGLEPDYILQIPLTGTLRKASIDKTKAAAKLSSLVAQSQGSPQGLVLGAVLGIVGGDLTEEKAPAPTTQPLPWAGTPSKEEALPRKKKRRNLLEDAASTIIDSVLH